MIRTSFTAEPIQDHPTVGVTRKVRVVSSTALDTPAKNFAAISDFLRDGTGPLASTGGELVGKSRNVYERASDS